MPRPTEEALEIAEKVIPGLPSHMKSAKKAKPRNPVARLGYEKTVMAVNNNGGRLPPRMKK
jgi:hypothetical protein